MAEQNAKLDAFWAELFGLVAEIEQRVSAEPEPPEVEA
jgi:hypothetical protein